MTSNEHDDRTRPTTAPYGQPYGGPSYGSPPGQPYAQPEYGRQPAQYGHAAPYEMQPAAYGQQYGTQPAGYGATYAGPEQGRYGPGRPAAVTVAAVLGFVFAALGFLVTLALVFLGAVSGGAAGGLDEAIPGFGSLAGAFAGVVIVLALLALAWTVVMILGSVRALSGRNRTLLLVGGSIAVATTGIGFLGGLADENATAGGAFVSFLFFAAAIAIVVLLCVRPAAQFFAAHRGPRGH